MALPFRDFEVASKHKTYQVLFYSDNEKLAQTLESHDFVITDARLTQELPIGQTALFEVEASEESKELSTVSRLVEQMATNGVSRQSKIAVVGGGFVQDIGGFSASIFMRGVNWSYFPTTLLSMGDSCVGGKTSINLRSGKNLVGSFYPPSEVHVFFGFLTTLPLALRVEGLIEMLKILAVAGELPNFSRGGVDSLLGGGDATRKLVHRSLAAKKDIVQVDEEDAGKRRLLNLGHTFGHALEVASSKGLQHGVAVGVGIIAASKFATLSGHESDLVLEWNIRELLDSLPRREVKIDWRSFREAILRDKKWTSERATLILPLSSGVQAWSATLNSELLENLEHCAQAAVRETLWR